MPLPPISVQGLGVAGVASLADVLLTIPSGSLRLPFVTPEIVAQLQGSILPSDLSRPAAVKTALDQTVVGANRFSKESPLVVGKKVAAIIDRAVEEAKDDEMHWARFQFLMGTLLMKDPVTFWHTLRVAQRLVGFAIYLGEVSDQPRDVRRRNDLLMGAALHDIGKLGMPDEIFTDRGRLSRREWKLIKSHPLMGYVICHHLRFSPEVLSMILYHHEQWGGNGYPFGLELNEIPLAAQLTSLADVYDTIISGRPYQEGISPRLAFERLHEELNLHQFDPDLLEGFITYHEGLV